jgi:guanylate kinase
MTKVFLTLTGPSCVGKSPLEAAVNRLYPGLLAARPVLCHSRMPRVGRGEVHGRDYYFLPAALIRSWADRPDFLVSQVHSAWQAIDLVQLEDLLAQHDLVFAVAYHTFGPSLARLAAERGFEVRSVFLQPVDWDVQTEQAAIVDLMLGKLQRRGTDERAKIERRALDALVEMAASGVFTHRLINPAGEDDVDEWGEFGTLGGVPGERAIWRLDDLGPNARWLVETFVEIAEGRLGPGDYKQVQRASHLSEEAGNDGRKGRTGPAGL